MNMHSDPRISGYLTRALSHEMGAVQQYLMQATLAGLWGMPELSARLHKDSGEELGHVGQIMQRMLELGIACNATQLAPVRPGRSVQEMLLIDREIELEVIHLYEEACVKPFLDSFFNFVICMTPLCRLFMNDWDR